jgi:hypothetical protein
MNTLTPLSSLLVLQSRLQSWSKERLLPLVAVPGGQSSQGGTQPHTPASKTQEEPKLSAAMEIVRLSSTTLRAWTRRSSTIALVVSSLVGSLVVKETACATAVPSWTAPVPDHTKPLGGFKLVEAAGRTEVYHGGLAHGTCECAPPSNWVACLVVGGVCCTTCTWNL